MYSQLEIGLYLQYLKNNHKKIVIFNFEISVTYLQLGTEKNQFKSQFYICNDFQNTLQ